MLPEIIDITENEIVLIAENVKDIYVEAVNTSNADTDLTQSIVIYEV